MAGRNRKKNKRVMQRVQKEVYSSAVRIFVNVDREVVSATPVDQGFAQSNWIPSRVNPSRKVTDRQKPVEGEGNQVWSAGRLGQRMWLSNNLPYIQRLNQGHSTQQPNPGYVQRAVKRGIR